MAQKTRLDLHLSPSPGKVIVSERSEERKAPKWKDWQTERKPLDWYIYWQLDGELEAGVQVGVAIRQW